MLILALLGCTGETPKTDDTSEPLDCSQFGLELPSPRGEVQGAWDPVNQRFLIFGGDEGTPENCEAKTSFVGDTWAWIPECDTFAEVSIDGDGPDARGRYVLVLDEARGRLILHGGRSRQRTSGDYTLYDDTWAFDLATDTWTLLSEGGPGARTNHGGAVLGDRFVVYGGNQSENGAAFDPLRDVWALDLVTDEWEELSPGSGPGARLFHSVAPNLEGTKLYAYGGGDENAFFGPFFGDLWELDPNDGWTELDDGTGDAPDNRIWANLVPDPDGESLVLWGGHDDGALGNRNDLWRFDLASLSWSQITEGDEYNAPANGFCNFPADFVNPDLSAPERRDAGAAAMDADGNLWIFGGKTDCGIINDIWSWSASAGWTERSAATAGEICERAFAECDTMCF